MASRPLPSILLALAPVVLGGCGGVGGTLSGTIDGVDYKPVQGYWGGPFIVFSADPIDCIDLSWVSKQYANDEVPGNTDYDVIQVTFNDADVVEGTFDISGVSPVSAAHLVKSGDSFDMVEATSGLLTIDSVKSGGKVKGNLDMSLPGGSLSGSFKVADCINLTSAY